MSEVQLRIECKQAFQDAMRIQQSIITKAENRVLLWLAARMPEPVNSDHLTALGFAGMLLAAASYAFCRYTSYGLLLACFFLALNWFGDSLDGTLARYRNRQRPRYGFYVDHVLDCFGVTALLAGMGFSRCMQPIFAAALLVAYLLLSTEIFLATHSLGRFQMSYFQLGPTELRILLAIGNLFLFLRPSTHPFDLSLSLFDFGAVIGGMGMVATAMMSAMRHGRMLYQAERVR